MIFYWYILADFVYYCSLIKIADRLNLVIIYKFYLHMHHILITVDCVYASALDIVVSSMLPAYLTFELIIKTSFLLSLL